MIRHEQIDIFNADFDADEEQRKLDFLKLKKIAIEAEDNDVIEIFLIDDYRLFYRFVSVYSVDRFFFRDSISLIQDEIMGIRKLSINKY